MHHLAKAGAAVCNPIAFEDGNLVMVVDEFLITQFERAPGGQVKYEHWDDELFFSWGQCIGQFHAEANSLRQPTYQRISWREDENINFRQRIPQDQTTILKYADQNLAMLSELPMSADIYGLIHSDAHGGNFFRQDKKITFFDFDDCCYQWFAFDVATILLGAINRPSVSASRVDQEAAALAFLRPFLTGYSKNFEVTDFLLKHLPLFLKTRELSLYAVIIAHMGIDNIEGEFAQQFMQGRVQRLENNEPFLALDFVTAL